MMVRKIVFPDAEESLAPLFTGLRLSILEELGEFIIFYGSQPDDETFIHRIADANAVISGWGLSNTVLAALPDLEIISFTGLGVSTFIDLAETTRRNITVTHTLSASETIAEHTMGLMLDAARHISRLDRDIRKGFWSTELVGLDLKGKTLGLVGFGRIAQAVVPLAQAFGMKVVCWTRNPNQQRAAQFNIDFMELDQLLTASDVISLHLSLTPETERLINADRLRLLKPGALIINTARSKIIDEKAFTELLRSGHIGAAGIDVFDDEPISPTHPFIEFDNVVMTPHVAYNTPDALEEMFDTAIENLVAYYSGRPQNVAFNSEA